MAALIQMRVLIVGMRSVGIEAAKNLVLAGPASTRFLAASMPMERRPTTRTFILMSMAMAALQGGAQGEGSW